MAATLRDDDNRDSEAAEGLSAAVAPPSGAGTAITGQLDQSWMLPLLHQAQEMARSAHGSMAPSPPPERDDATGDTPSLVPRCPVLDEHELPSDGGAQDVWIDGDGGDSGTNPYGFLAPPSDALVTMALVEWTNTATGARWTAPSGGYQPPDDTWVRVAPPVVENGQPDPGDMDGVLPREDGDSGAGEDAAIAPWRPWEPWETVTYTATLIDETGAVVGYETVTESGDPFGNWTHSTQRYTADWRSISSSYTDNTGFSYTFETLWSDDGVELGHLHRFTGAGNTYVSETVYSADWQLVSSSYEDPASGYRSLSEFWYDEAGTLVGGSTTQFWTDDNGPQSSTENWWVNEPAEAAAGPSSPDASSEQPLDPLPGESSTEEGQEEVAVSEASEALPESETPSEQEVIPEIIVCPGVIEVPPDAEGPGDDNAGWPPERVDPAPEIIVCPDEPEPGSLDGVDWEAVQWDTGTGDPEFLVPEICVLPPPLEEPFTFDPGWLRPATIDFERPPLVGVLVEATFG